MSRPTPPEVAGSVEEFVKHVVDHPADWVSYLRNNNDYISEIEKQYEKTLASVASLQRQLAERVAATTKLEGIVQYQKEQTDSAQEKITRLEIEKSQLLAASASVVHTPVTDPPVEIERSQLPATSASTVHTPDTDPPVAPQTAEIVASTITETPVSSLTVTSRNATLSEKLPDLKEFDGTRSDLRRFSQQIYGKMTANADRFLNASA